jgi:hypothetical protein
MVVVADPMPETAPTMEAMATPAPQPIAPAVSPMHSMTANVQAIGVAPAAQQAAARPAQTAPRGGLFAEPSRPVAAAPAAPTNEPPRVSLFSTVTGAFRRRQAAAAMAAEPANPARPEPTVQEARPAEQPRASVRQTAGDEVAGLDIPAFLRRQSS